jgi:hypothetical protein
VERYELSNQPTTSLKASTSREALAHYGVNAIRAGGIHTSAAHVAAKCGRGQSAADEFEAQRLGMLDDLYEEQNQTATTNGDRP